MVKLQTISVRMLRCDNGLKVHDAVTQGRLYRSVRLLGVLRPIIVCECEDSPEFDVVDGRGLLVAAIECGYDSVECIVLPSHSKAQAMLLLEIGFERDYAAIARHVAKMPETAEHLADHSPWNVERIQGFRELSTFDWSLFKGDEVQSAFSWDEE